MLERDLNDIVKEDAEARWEEMLADPETVAMLEAKRRREWEEWVGCEDPFADPFA